MTETESAQGPTVSDTARSSHELPSMTRATPLPVHSVRSPPRPPGGGARPPTPAPPPPARPATGVCRARPRPVPFATRHLYRGVLDQLGSRGYDFVAGLEVEFHIFKLEDARMSPDDAGQPGNPPSVSLPPPG